MDKVKSRPTFFFLEFHSAVTIGKKRLSQLPFHEDKEIQTLYFRLAFTEWPYCYSSFNDITIVVKM